MTPRFTNKLNLSFIVDNRGGVGGGKEGGERGQYAVYMQNGLAEEKEAVLFHQSHGCAVVAENQLKTDGRRDLPPDAFVPS